MTVKNSPAPGVDGDWACSQIPFRWINCSQHIFFYFQDSSKRRQYFIDQWCLMFTTEPDAHCPTRWISILRCIKRYLKQFDGLRSFFMSCEEAETAKAQSIVARLWQFTGQPLLHFLPFILSSIDHFNRLFHSSTLSRCVSLLLLPWYYINSFPFLVSSYSTICIKTQMICYYL